MRESQLLCVTRLFIVISYNTMDCIVKYIGWSDVTVICGYITISVVGQHGVKCKVKWWRLVALLEWNWISWFKQMSVLSQSYWGSDVTITNVSQSLPHIMAEKLLAQIWYEEITSLSPYMYSGLLCRWMRRWAKSPLLEVQTSLRRLHGHAVMVLLMTWCFRLPFPL